jgi:hypothetical protein
MDYVLYMVGQSAAMTGKPDEAVAFFKKLAPLSSRFKTLAKFRTADCLHEAGKVDEAKAMYAALLSSASDEVDTAVALFRTGQYKRVYVEHPLHPFAEPALQKLEANAITPTPSPLA